MFVHSLKALIATHSLERDFDLGSAVRSLLAAQREDGSVGSFLDSYYVLPALSNATLLNVTAEHCKRPDISGELQSNRSVQKVAVFFPSTIFCLSIFHWKKLKRNFVLTLALYTRRCTGVTLVTVTCILCKLLFYANRSPWPSKARILRASPFFYCVTSITKTVT